MHYFLWALITRFSKKQKIMNLGDDTKESQIDREKRAGSKMLRAHWWLNGLVALNKPFRESSILDLKNGKEKKSLVKRRHSFLGKQVVSKHELPWF